MTFATARPEDWIPASAGMTEERQRTEARGWLSFSVIPAPASAGVNSSPRKWGAGIQTDMTKDYDMRYSPTRSLDPRLRGDDGREGAGMTGGQAGSPQVSQPHAGFRARHVETPFYFKNTKSTPNFHFQICVKTNSKEKNKLGRFRLNYWGNSSYPGGP